MTKVLAPYLYRKRGIYYLQKRIPTDLVPHYGANSIQKSLRTRDRAQAVRISSNVVLSFVREWQDLRVTVPKDVAASDFLKSGVLRVPLITEAAHTYCKMKGKADDKRFCGYVSHVVAEVVTVSGNTSIKAYTRADALWFRDVLAARRVAQATVKRNFEFIRAVCNFAASENAVDVVNPFSNMNYGSGAKPVKRMSISMDYLKAVQSECLLKDDDMRC